MHIETSRMVISLAFAILTAPALADDCTTVKSAMLNSGHTPKSLTITKTDGQGRKTVTRQVQTVDNKYVQLPDGKWYAMNIAIKDLNDNLSGLLTCRRSASESVGSTRWLMSLSTGSLEKIEMPRSPCISRQTQSANCT